MTNKEATAEVARLVEQAYAALREATRIADESGVVFSFGPEYGMGGTYYPDTDYSEEWEQSAEWSSSNSGWVASSAEC